MKKRIEVKLRAGIGRLAAYAVIFLAFLPLLLSVVLHVDRSIKLGLRVSFVVLLVLLPFLFAKVLLPWVEKAIDKHNERFN